MKQGAGRPETRRWICDNPVYGVRRRLRQALTDAGLLPNRKTLLESSGTVNRLDLLLHGFTHPVPHRRLSVTDPCRGAIHNVVSCTAAICRLREDCLRVRPRSSSVGVCARGFIVRPRRSVSNAFELPREQIRDRFYEPATKLERDRGHLEIRCSWVRAILCANATEREPPRTPAGLV